MPVTTKNSKDGERTETEMLSKIHCRKFDRKSLTLLMCEEQQMEDIPKMHTVEVREILLDFLFTKKCVQCLWLLLFFVTTHIICNHYV